MTGWPWPLSSVQDWFEGIWDGITDWFESVWDAIWSAGQWIVSQLSAAVINLGSTVWGYLQGVWTWISEGLTDLGSRVWGFFQWVWDSISTALTDLGSRVWGYFTWLRDQVIAIAAGIPSAIGSLAAWITDSITPLFGNLWSNILGFFGWVRDSVLSGIQALQNGMVTLGGDISAWLDGASRSFGDAIFSLPAMIGDLLKGFFTWLYDQFVVIAQVVAGLARAVMDGINWVFSSISKGFVEQITGAIKPGSPPHELEDSFKEMFTELEKDLEKSTRIPGKSIPPYESILAAGIGVVAKFISIKVLVEGLAAAADHAHPLKDVGFYKIVAGILGTLDLPFVISPLLKVPIDTGILRQWTFHWQERYRPTLPGFGELIEMTARGGLSFEVYSTTAGYLGYHFDYITAAWTAHWQPQSVRDLEPMLWRGFITKDKFVSELQRGSISPEMADNYLKLTERIPGPQDLITFVVREAFMPEMRTTAPTEFTDWMIKQGYTEYWATTYWSAHWILVPLGQLYDMFHRELIDQATLRQQIIFHDYRPEWADRLIKLSYSLIPRIDLRRGWEAGLIDEAELTRRYALLGFSPEDSELEARLQIRFALSAEITALRSETEKDFVDGWIDEGTARANLEELGFAPAFVDYRMAALKARRDREEKAELEKIYRESFYKDIITSEDLASNLAGLNKQPDYIERVVAFEQIRKLPTKKAKAA